MGWVISGGVLTNTNFPEMPQNTYAPEYPILGWRVEAGKNSGFPFFKLAPTVLPITVPVEQNQYICIYDMMTDAPLFEGNGLAILRPTKCEITEILNDEYSLTMTHPIDSEGRWRYIKERNIVKALGQLFTIMQVEWHWTGRDSGEVTVFAEHIFYQLGDPWIFPEDYGDSPPQCYDATTVLAIAESGMYYHAEPGQMNYNYDWRGDGETTGTSMTYDDPYLYTNDEGRTFLDVIMGSSGILAVKGGELYRDNFYFSIRETMEFAKTDAFDIRLGLNERGITAKVDLSTFCSYFRCIDNFGGWFAWAWKPDTFILTQFPHHVIRSCNITFDEDKYNFDLVGQKATEEFKKNCYPVICYEIDIADVRRNPDYKENNPNFEYRPGNTGRLYDTRLGAGFTIKITETTTDAITGDVIKVVFGARRSFTRSADYPIIIDGAPEIDSAGVAVRDADGAFCYDADGKRIVQTMVSST